MKNQLLNNFVKRYSEHNGINVKAGAIRLEKHWANVERIVIASNYTSRIRIWKRMVGYERINRIYAELQTAKDTGIQGIKTKTLMQKNSLRVPDGEDIQDLRNEYESDTFLNDTYQTPNSPSSTPVPKLEN